MGTRTRRIDRAVAMHATSTFREESARLLARVVREVGADGAAFGWTDELEPSVLVPVHAVTAVPGVSWDARLPGSLRRTIDDGGTRVWSLLVRGTPPERVGAADRLVSFAEGWFAAAEDRECPALHPAIWDGAAGRLAQLLHAYRFVAFRLERPDVIPLVRGEIDAAARDLPERVRRAAAGVRACIVDHPRLVSELLGLGRALEQAGELPAAATVHVIGYELALCLCDATAGIDFARAAGRAYRSLTEWDEAFRWYGLARRLAELEADGGRLAVVLDGLGNTHRWRGAFPKARQCYDEGWRVALRSGVPGSIAAVGHSMMTVHREAGRLDEAARYGWTALQAQPDPAERANLLLNLGTLLRDGGDLEAAVDAYELVRIEAEAPALRMMAADALAYCAALGGGDGYAAWRRLAARESRGVTPYLRAQVGYYRGASLRALGEPARAVRVLRAVERYAAARDLHEWSVKAAELAARPLPQPAPVEMPAELRQGLRAMRELSVA